MIFVETLPDFQKKIKNKSRQRLKFSPERSVGENEFCGNEVEEKLRNFSTFRPVEPINFPLQATENVFFENEAEKKFINPMKSFDENHIPQRQLNTLNTQVVENYIEENGNVIKHDKTIVKNKNGNQTVEKYIYPSSTLFSPTPFSGKNVIFRHNLQKVGPPLRSATRNSSKFDNKNKIYRELQKKNIKKRKKTNKKKDVINKVSVGNRKKKLVVKTRKQR